MKLNMDKIITNELLDIISGGEGITTEFKKATNKLPNNLFETVCSFSNRNGGNIFLGVDDSGDIIGVDKDSISKMKKEFANLCNNEQKINPTVYLNINDYLVEDKYILHIYVSEGSSVYRTNGKVFDRNEDGDYEVKSQERIANIYIRKQDFYTENKIFPYATIDDLRPDLMKRAIQMAINRSNTRHAWADLTYEQMLRSANLYAKDFVTGKEGLTLAAILLFGKDEVIMSCLPHHKTDLIYRVNNLDRYDDREDIRTNLLESFDRMMAFVEKHLDDKFYIEDNQRIDVRNKIAREIVVNMLIHREFSNPYPAKLIIEKDCIKTENANRAKMIGKINVDSFEPYPKNPKIAAFFKEIGLADELGSGVRNITKYTKIYSGGFPEFKEDDIFITIIPLAIYNIGKAQDKVEKTQDEVKKTQDEVKKTQDEVKKTQDEVKKTQDVVENNIIEFCKVEKSIFEIMNYVGYKNRNRFTRDYITPMVERKLLYMTIPDKPTSKNQKYVSIKDYN